jgi:hypothetical protein
MSTLKTINIQHPTSANPNIILDANGDMSLPIDKQYRKLRT